MVIILGVRNIGKSCFALHDMIDFRKLLLLYNLYLRVARRSIATQHFIETFTKSKKFKSF